jgi:hypothetical protein
MPPSPPMSRRWIPPRPTLNPDQPGDRAARPLCPQRAAGGPGCRHRRLAAGAGYHPARLKIPDQPGAAGCAPAMPAAGGWTTWMPPSPTGSRRWIPPPPDSPDRPSRSEQPGERAAAPAMPAAGGWRTWMPPSPTGSRRWIPPRPTPPTAPDTPEQPGDRAARPLCPQRAAGRPQASPTIVCTRLQKRPTACARHCADRFPVLGTLGWRASSLERSSVCLRVWTGDDRTVAPCPDCAAASRNCG